MRWNFPLSGMATGLFGLTALTACDRAGPDPVQSEPAATSLLARFLVERGEDFERCFAGKPAMADPGAIQPGPGTSARPAEPPAALIVAIDASGSMAARIGGETKMVAARRAATSFLAGVGPETRVGLVAFGHRGSNRPEGKAASCAAVEPVFALGAANAEEIGRALGQVEATGWTPLAAAIETAGRQFAPGGAPGRQVVYVVSDGLETCGGDPVAAARALNAGAVKAIVNIIGFDLTPADRAQLRAVASAGGGALVEARSATALSAALDGLFRKAASVSAITTERLDGGARTAANNMAAGRYTATMNMCVGKTQSAEIMGLPNYLDTTDATPADREAARVALAARHERYRQRAQTTADEVLAGATGANDAIRRQTRASEVRLGVDR